MGNGNANCCDAFSSNTAEFSLSSPQTRRSYHDLSQVDFPQMPNTEQYHPSSLENRIKALKSLTSAKLLRLKIINSGNLPKGSLLYIDPSGLQGSLRSAGDGYTFFGSKKKQNGETVNDFIIPIENSEEAESHRGRHFLILYQIDKDTYWIRDLAKGFGVFVRLDYALVLRDNMLVNMGESFIVVNVARNDDQPALQMKMFSGNVSGELW